MNRTPKPQLIQHLFTYQGKPFRMLQEVRETWYIAADVCKALGLSQVSRMFRIIEPCCKKKLKVSPLQQPNRFISMNVIDYIGLEQMMLLGTTQAVDSFQRWLQLEVFPVEQRYEDRR